MLWNLSTDGLVSLIILRSSLHCATVTFIWNSWILINQISSHSATEHHHNTYDWLQAWCQKLMCALLSTYKWINFLILHINDSILFVVYIFFIEYISETIHFKDQMNLSPHHSKILIALCYWQLCSKFMDSHPPNFHPTSQWISLHYLVACNHGVKN